MKSRTVSLFVLGILLAVLLAACSPASPTSQPSEPAPAAQPQAGSHPPVILRVENREEVIEGAEHNYADIYFTDPDGDAVAVTYREISTSLSYQLHLTDEPIEATVEQQKGEALFTAGGRCPYRLELVLEITIRDRAGNLSEPVTVPLYHCTTPPLVDAQSFLIKGISVAIPLALILTLGFWLLFRKRPEERLPALRSTLFLFCLFLPLNFIGSVLHEGGHALVNLASGVGITDFVIHPFPFTGYVRPYVDPSNVWSHASGDLSFYTGSLLLFILCWKRRSPGLLPLLLLFSMTAIGHGLAAAMMQYDYNNLVNIIGIPALLIQIPGQILIAVGIFLTLSLFPLLGLSPHDKKSLFVIPAGYFLYNILGLAIACLFVTGSSVYKTEWLVEETLTSTYQGIILGTVLGLILSALYVSLYRWISPKLPAWLRTETVALTWKDLRLPAVLAVICVTLGLIILLLLPACARQPQPARIEEITFQSGEFTIVGDLRTPSGTGPFPVILFVHGSGLEDRTSFGMYLPIMERMLDAGYAVFSWDKPGAGESTGQVDNTPRVLQKSAQIVLDAIEVMKSHSDIDPRRIGLWGISQGGWVMPLVLSQSEDVAFMICVSCGGMSSHDQGLYLNTMQSICAGVPEEQAEELKRLLSELDKARTYDTYAGYVHYRETLDALAGVASVKDYNDRTVVPEAAWQANDPEIVGWWNPIGVIEQTTIPVLAIFGERDPNVDGIQGAFAWRKALERAGNPNFRVELLPGIGHVMEKSQTGCLEEQARTFEQVLRDQGIESIAEFETFITGKEPGKQTPLSQWPYDPAFLDILEQWIKALPR